MTKYHPVNFQIFVIAICGGLAGLFYSSVGSAASLDFSEEEQQWLTQHKMVVTGVDSDFAPYEWVTVEGVHKGMVSDYLALIGDKTGIDFRHYSGSGWTDVLEKAKAREVDILAAAAISPQRQESFDFTDAYIRMPGVIISTEEYGSLEDLKGKKIAVVSNYVWDDLLTAYNADARVVRVEDTFTGVELTSLKGVDAMLSDPGTVSQAISKGGFTNLRISGYLEQALVYPEGETIEGAMRITDEVVAEKDRLITELKAQLETVPSGDAGRQAASELLDGDEVIQQERAKLLELQESWKEKLRKAEIEISVERAKLARERSKMEEQIQALEARLAERSDAPAGAVEEEAQSRGALHLARTLPPPTWAIIGEPSPSMCMRTRVPRTICGALGSGSCASSSCSAIGSPTMSCKASRLSWSISRKRTPKSPP